jgi:hypothetical protein
MMPLSYQGLGFTAIMLMIGILVGNQSVKSLKDYFQKNDHEKKPPEFL